jgi:hypothetical protein
MDGSTIACWAVGCPSMLGSREGARRCRWLGGDGATSPMVKRAFELPQLYKHAWLGSPRT